MKYVFPEFTAPEGYMRAVVRLFLLGTWSFRRSRSTQANEVVAAEVRNHIIWTVDEVCQCPGVGEGRLTNSLR
jgi:hypothetical protein